MKKLIALIVVLVGVLRLGFLYWEHKKPYMISIKYIPMEEGSAPLGEVLGRADFDEIGYSLSFESENLKSRVPNEKILYTQTGEARNLGYFIDVLEVDYDVVFKARGRSLLVMDK